MKITERKKAINLRHNGLTYNEISKRLNVSKGSLSLWLHNVPFTLRDTVSEKRRQASLKNGQILHKQKIERTFNITKISKREILPIKPYELKMLGAIAYWTEGSKTQDSLVKFTNSNPKFIKLAVKWLREICKVPERKIKVHLRIHKNLNTREVKKYWSKITNIPLSRFYKTTIKTSDSKGKRHNKLEYGVASIIVCDTNLFYKIMGWIEGIVDKLE